MPSPYKRMDEAWRALKRCGERELLFCQRSVLATARCYTPYTHLRALSTYVQMGTLDPAETFYTYARSIQPP